MDAQTAATIMEDFLVWSGGFPPESDQQIFVYAHAASPVDADPEDVRAVLRDWMEREAPEDADQ